MVNEQVLQEAKKQIGIHLRKLRTDRNIGLKQLGNITGMSNSQILDIELNRRSYGIENFLKYVQALDMYFFLSEKEGHHLDFEHMASKADPDKAAL
jgi:transcriptional regulator with XRE-family HTH domain